MPARSEGAGGARAGARAGGRREEGGRRRGRARALGAGLQRRLLWRSRPEPPPSSPLLSSCSPAAAGLGPGGARVSPGLGWGRGRGRGDDDGAGCGGPGEASRPPWGSGAPPPQPLNMAGRGARRAGVAGGQPRGPARPPRRSPTGALRGSRVQHPLGCLGSQPQAPWRCGGPRLLPFSTSVQGGLFPAGRCSRGRLFSRQDCGVRRGGSLFLRGDLMPRAHAYPRLQG